VDQFRNLILCLSSAWSRAFRQTGEASGRLSVRKAGGRRTKNFTSNRAPSAAFARKNIFLRRPRTPDNIRVLQIF